MSGRETPKIIWQTHEWEYADLPKNFLATSMTWQNLNPTWEYRYVSAANRVGDVKEFDETLYKLYLFADGMTQADIWRYVSIYKYGGVYADMDSICVMPLDYLIETNWIGEEFLATELDANGHVNNANFGAPSRNPLMKLVLDNILDSYKNINIYQILVRSQGKDDFWHLLKTELRTSWSGYSDVLVKNKNLVSFNFMAAEHSEDFKTKFESDFHVNYFGAFESYSSLAARSNWKTYIDNL